ncbi:hypothetical protein COI_2181 [Mannheimia haemolytica serotype A2 str. OVINE]|nr:hypothetical protein COI_2181 [Mannheimia haemolytica serotype A2 str. OVINE]
MLVNTLYRLSIAPTLQLIILLLVMEAISADGLSHQMLSVMRHGKLASSHLRQPRITLIYLSLLVVMVRRM